MPPTARPARLWASSEPWARPTAPACSSSAARRAPCALNAAAHGARGRFLVFLHDDVVPRPGWLDALRAPAEADPAVGVVGAKLLIPGTLQVQHAGLAFGATRTPYPLYQGWNADHPAVDRPRVLRAVVTYNSALDLPDCLRTLLALDHTGEPVELVVIDNASSDGTRSLLAALAGRQPNVTVILNDDNRGFARAVTKGSVRRPARAGWPACAPTPAAPSRRGPSPSSARSSPARCSTASACSTRTSS